MKLERDLQTLLNTVANPVFQVRSRIYISLTKRNKGMLRVLHLFICETMMIFLAEVYIEHAPHMLTDYSTYNTKGSICLIFHFSFTKFGLYICFFISALKLPIQIIFKKFGWNILLYKFASEHFVQNDMNIYDPKKNSVYFQIYNLTKPFEIWAKLL